ncbi:MAG: acyltransferase [Pedobacter sp.]|jgi:acetyltransferase-like isoleucine patch superfamily enzyme|uniref:acyltransferase n=1 Tax=Pedobacter sp. TaxID=1411316 RepID=UPI0035640868
MRRLKLFLLKYKNQLRFYFNKNISSKIFMGSGVQILGVDNILIKDNCTIGENTLFTINNRFDKSVQLTIGRNVYVGRDNFFSVGKSINISDYCIFGNKCSFICSDHIFDNPLIPYALSGNSYEKAIFIETNCWLGHNVSVIGNVRIGYGSIVGANTVITKDIPPFSMVVGNPAKIIKTYNFSLKKWIVETSDAPKFENEDDYLSYLKSNNGDVNLGFHSGSSKAGHL